MFELAKGIHSILQACRTVESGEKVLVIADSDGGSMWVGQSIMDVVNLMGAEAVLTVVTPRGIIGEEPPHQW